jgi:hypothetical protein
MKTVIPLLAEYLGTFLLTLSVLSLTNPLFIGIIFTIILILVIPLSGGCVNPAITFALYMSSKLSWRESLFYVVIQLLAALSAYLTYDFLK